MVGRWPSGEKSALWLMKNPALPVSSGGSCHERLAAAVPGPAGGVLPGPGVWLSAAAAPPVCGRSSVSAGVAAWLAVFGFGTVRRGSAACLYDLFSHGDHSLADQF